MSIILQKITSTCICSVWTVGQGISMPPNEAPGDSLPPGHVAQPLENIVCTQRQTRPQKHQPQVPPLAGQRRRHMHWRCDCHLSHFIASPSSQIPPRLPPEAHGAPLFSLADKQYWGSGLVQYCQFHWEDEVSWYPMRTWKMPNNRAYPLKELSA